MKMKDRLARATAYLKRFLPDFSRREDRLRSSSWGLASVFYAVVSHRRGGWEEEEGIDGKVGDVGDREAHALAFSIDVNEPCLGDSRKDFVERFTGSEAAVAGFPRKLAVGAPPGGPAR
jgi:hypothetical protein